jgi:hypothetical protein
MTAAIPPTKNHIELLLAEPWKRRPEMSELVESFATKPKIIRRIPPENMASEKGLFIEHPLFDY